MNIFRKTTVMKTNYFLSVLLFLCMYLFLSCDKEEDKMPSACFTATKTAMVGDIINFDNCSDDATRYGWDFDDGIKSTDISPTHQYESSGNYSVTLTAYNKDKANQFTMEIVIEGDAVSYDPKDYYGPSNYYKDFFIEDFNSNENEWYEGSEDSVSAHIINGFYTITNSKKEYDQYFFSAYNGPGENTNFDIEYDVKITNYVDTYSAGVIWGKKVKEWELYFHFISPYGNFLTGEYLSGFDYWIEWTDGGLESPANNKITVRKVNNYYYYFVNKKYILKLPVKEFHGDIFGLTVGATLSVEYDLIHIKTINTDKKKSGEMSTKNNLQQKTEKLLNNIQTLSK